VYRSWRLVADSYDGDRALIGEVWMPYVERFANYLRPDELHAAFNFDLLEAPWSAPAMRRTIAGCLAASATVGAPATWVLSNHDSQRHLTRYGSGDRARRSRPADAGATRLGLPYQGEELGLPEVLDLPDDCRQDPRFFRSGGAVHGRDGCRVPIRGAATPRRTASATPARRGCPAPKAGQR